MDLGIKGRMPEEGTAATAAVFRFEPNHGWWYFSNMYRDETKALRVPHTAFHDPSFPDAY